MAALPKIIEKMSRDRTGSDRYDIIECALQNDFKGVRWALERDPESINDQRRGIGITALMAASGRGLDDMVTFLLRQPHIDIDIVDDAGKTALEHGRLFPSVVSKIMNAKFPKGAWKDPGLRLV